MTVDLAGKVVAVSRNGKTFVRGTVYNKRHYNAVKARFEAWDKQGWPYVIPDERHLPEDEEKCFNGLTPANLGWHETFPPYEP